MEQTKSNHGFLNLILGPMFSGKSTRLIHYIRKYKTLKFSMIIAKPSIDTRYTGSNEICTHNFEKESCTTFLPNELHKIFDDPIYQTSNIIIIEEGQFFSSLYDIFKNLCNFLYL